MSACQLRRDPSLFNSNQPGSSYLSVNDKRLLTPELVGGVVSYVGQMGIHLSRLRWLRD